MKSRHIIVPVLILIVLSTITIWVWKPFSKEPQYELLEVRRGAVAATVSVSGSVVSDEKVELAFLSPGIVKEVKVAIGDRIKAGDLLIILDTEILKHQAAQARASAAVTQAMFNQVQGGLRSVDRSVFDQTLNSSRVALDNATASLQDAYRARDVEIANARMTLKNTQIAYNNALNIYNASQGSISQSLEIAKVALSNSLTMLSSARSSYNIVLNLYNLGQVTWFELQQAQSVLSGANVAYLSTRANYDAALRQVVIEKAASKSNLDMVRSQLDNAHAVCDSILVSTDIKIGSAQNGLAVAQAAYDLAYAQYNQANAPASRADTNAAAAQVAASYAMVRSIEAQITKARLIAPINGVVTAVNVEPGELTSIAQPVVILETNDDFCIETYISEVDIDKIQIGQDVKIEFDALDKIVTKGTVINIDPAATVLMGVINYRITVALQQTIMELRPSMTADLDILVESREDVIFLPRRTLTRDGDSYTVRVLTSAGDEERKIEIGLMGDTEVEIILGLTEGEQIILREL